MATAQKNHKPIDCYSPEQILAGYGENEIALHQLLRDDPIAFAKVACGFTPHSKQVEVLQTPLEKHKSLLPWPRRTGKSQILATYIAWKLFAVKGYNAYIFAPSGDQSRILFDYIADIYESSPYLSRYMPARETGNIITVGGSKWKSTVEHVKTGLVGDAARGRGDRTIRNSDGDNRLLVFDEIASFLYPEQVTEAIKPYVLTGGGMVLLSSPGELGSWMHQTYLDWKEQERLGMDRYRVFECNAYDVDHISAERIEEERLEAIRMDRLWFFEREYLGKWVSTQGAFFDRKDVERCVVQGELTGGRGDVWIYSLDPGLDRSPSVLLISRFNQSLARLEIVDCRSLIRGTNDYVDKNDGHETIEQYEEIIDIILEERKRRPIHTFYIDPGCEKNIGERLKNSFGVNVVDCRIGGYSQKLTALKDLQRSIGDSKIVWQDTRITRQLLEFAPPVNRQTGRYEFPDKNYDIIAAMTQLNRFIGDREVTPFFCEVATRKRGDLW